MDQQRRNFPGTEEEKLKKIAEAEAINKGIKKPGMGTVQRNQDRDFVKNVRNPAKFNMMTFNRENN